MRFNDSLGDITYFMRPIFFIYLAAGVTLFFAVLNVAAYVGHAYFTHNFIVSLKVKGDDLDRIRAVQDQDLELASEAFGLTLLQTGIIISARKLNKLAVSPSNLPEPIGASVK